MGVQGLWDALNKASQSRSLAHLAVVDGFEGNKSGKRAYRVGIDASIWYHHASFAKGGENPELRLLFYRIRTLAELPLLPLFVFDGRERPKVKRGSKMGKSGSHNLTDSMKKVLDTFGMEWRMALGEAEAELAYLNRSGVIDAIMTDDADAFVFGALTIIKNPGLKLSGNKSNPALNSAGKASVYHVMVFTAEAIRNHPEVRLTRGGMVLIALLAGGDYDKGVENFGKDIGRALARCGFGDELLTLFGRRTQEDIRPFLAHWRSTVNQELHSNSRGFLRHKYHSLNLPVDFPNLQVLENYVNPVCSGRVGRQGGGPMRGNGEMNVARIAGLCEQKFGEWGYRSEILKRFRTLIWKASIMRVLRRAALEADEKEKEKRLNAGRKDWSIIGEFRPSRAEAIGTPSSLVKKCLDMSDLDRRRAAFMNDNNSGESHARENETHPLIAKIVGSRKHVSTDGMLEYRVVACPAQLVALARSGIKGIRPEPAGDAIHLDDDFWDAVDGSTKKKQSKKPPAEPDSSFRLWIPASMMRHVHPGLVEEFEAADVAKTKKFSGKAKGKGKARADDSSGDDDLPSSDAEAPIKLKRQPKKTVIAPVPQESLSQTSSSSSIIDPWFVPDQGYSTGLSHSPSDTLSAYFLCSQNPDDPCALDSPPVEEDNQSGDDDMITEDGPRDRFDIIFDQIMGISGDPPRPQKSTVPGRQKRPRSSILDGIEGGSQIAGSQGLTVKKKKTQVPELYPPTNFDRHRLPALRVIDLTEEMPASRALARRNLPYAASLSGSRVRDSKVVTGFRSHSGRRLHHPTSSQDSSLFLDDADVIIDLT